jgi:AcrR family transcriptional regulator
MSVIVNQWHPATAVSERSSTSDSTTAERLAVQASAGGPASDASQPTLVELATRRPKRADARRNYDRILAAARAAFSKSGSSTSLEEIARRAEVGIGTLYRNFPSRQALLEAVYVDEVDQLCRSATTLMELEPWPAFEEFCRRLVVYLHTKQALAAELFDSGGRDTQVFTCCKSSLLAGAQPLLARAQAARVLREDVQITDLFHLLGGVAKIHGTDEAQFERILAIALDGLRYRG